MKKRVSAGTMQRERGDKEGAGEMKANREGNPGGLVFERELQAGAETPRKDGEQPQQPNKWKVDLRWLKMEPLTEPAGAVAADRGCPSVPALPGR